ncbi:unnamed protein product [Musa banksii]
MSKKKKSTKRHHWLSSLTHIAEHEKHTKQILDISLAGSSENFLELLHLLVVEESDLLHQRRGQAVGKERKCGDLKPRVGATEAHECDGGDVPGIDLEVKLALREDHGVSLVERREVDIVGGGDEASADGAFDDEKQLGATGVGVKGDDAVGGDVEAGGRHAESVDARELADEGWRHGGLDEVGSIAGHTETREDEVVAGDCGDFLARVTCRGIRGGEFADAEVLHKAIGSREEEEEEEDAQRSCSTVGHFALLFSDFGLEGVI